MLTTLVMGLKPMILNDEHIRKALRKYVSRMTKPKRIIEELRVHNGNAIADLVCINTYAHCYEIKGETDNLHKISSQGDFFQKTFQKITLVTTENHLNSATRILPNNWGLLLAYKQKGSVKFRYIRKHIDNRKFEPHLALSALWKEELQLEFEKIYQMPPKRSLTREELINKLIMKLSAKNTQKTITQALLNRDYSNSFSM